MKVLTQKLVPLQPSNVAYDKWILTASKRIVGALSA